MKYGKGCPVLDMPDCEYPTRLWHLWQAGMITPPLDAVEAEAITLIGAMLNG